MELFTAPCQCEIEQLTLSGPSAVTYHVAANSDATVSSITYQLGENQVTVENPELPFSKTVKLDIGQTVALLAIGNPKGGNIVLTYETQDPSATPTDLSASVSRVWVQRDGNCQ